MFLFDRKRRYVTIKIRNEWGVLQKVTLKQDASHLTDQELADELEVSKITVITHRRD